MMHLKLLSFRTAWLLTGLLTLIQMLPGTHAQAQEKSGRDLRFPLIVSIQFHGFSLPFRDVGYNFRNIGISVGTEVGLNRKENLLQQFSIGWHVNRTMGNNLLLHTQVAWRSHTETGFYSDLKAGIGYAWYRRPVESFRVTPEGWASAGKKGKGMLAIPLSIAAGYNQYAQGYSPFAAYTFAVMGSYNESVPIVPATYLQVGSRIY